jgi:hypothetical protein
MSHIRPQQPDCAVASRIYAGDDGLEGHAPCVSTSSITSSVFAELEKPSWERKPVRNFRPTQRLNQLLFQHRIWIRSSCRCRVARNCHSPPVSLLRRRQAILSAAQGVSPVAGGAALRAGRDDYRPVHGQAVRVPHPPQARLSALLGGREPCRRRRATECEPTTGRPVAD